MSTISTPSIDPNITYRFCKKINDLSQVQNTKESFFRTIIVPYHIQLPDFKWKERCNPKRIKMAPVIQYLILTAVKDIFSHTEKKPAITSQKVLEIGSGTLNSNQQSYLSQFFVSSSNLDWTFSDVTAITKNYPKNKSHLPLNLLDQSSCNTHPFDTVIGCNVLDTLPYQDFQKIFQKINSLLKPNQYFVHIADLDLYLSAFIDVCIKDNYILLPTNSGLCRISKNQYNTILEKVKGELSKEDFSFLQNWQAQSPQIQGAILNDALMDKWDLSSLINKVQKIFQNHLESINQVEIFEKHLKSAAEKNNWRILKCQYITGYVKTQQLDLSLSNNKTNTYKLDQGSLFSSFDEKLPIGQEVLEANIHIFIAARA